MKKLLNTFSGLLKNKKNVYVLTAAALIVLISVAISSLNSGDEIAQRSYTKLKGSDLNNKDATYKTGGRADEIVALEEEERRHKEETLKQENTVYIPTTRNYELNASDVVVREEKPKKQEVTDDIAIFNEDLSAIERVPVDSRGREIRDRHGNPVNTNSETMTPEDLSMIYALNDSFTRAYGAHVSNQSLDQATATKLMSEKEDKPGVEVSEDFRIIPGSTFYGTLLTPITSIFTEAKVVVRLTTGDLDGWTAVGNANLKSLGSGMVMQINKLVSPKGEEKSVDGLVFSDQTGSPGFKDDIDHYLFQRIGYSLLGDISETIGDTLGTRMEAKNQAKTYGLNKNNTGSGQSGTVCIEYQTVGNSAVCTKYGIVGSDPNQRVQTNDETVYTNSTTQAIKNAVIGKGARTTGTMLGSVFDEMANGYRTEVKVNPQSVIVIFY